MKHPKISAGYLVKCGDKYLLGRPFHSVFWSIFKGGQHKGESLIETAKRELKEESGLDIDDLLENKIIGRKDCEKLLLKYDVKKKKLVYVYLLELPESFLNEEFFCTSYMEDISIPEVVDYHWFTKKELKNAIFRSQLCVLKKI